VDGRADDRARGTSPIVTHVLGRLYWVKRGFGNWKSGNRNWKTEIENGGRVGLHFCFPKSFLRTDLKNPPA